MATSSSWTQEYDCSADILYGIITSGDFHKERSALLDNPKTEIKEIEQTETVRRFEVHATEYAKGLTGIDRSKTEQSVGSYTCDLVHRTVTWNYVGPQGKRVKVWGDMAVTETSRGARVKQNFNVDIRIPLVGGKIEKLVAKKAAELWPRYENLVDEWVAKATK
jgi:hypothetical protein